jgi:hypothetical protein
VCKEKLLLLLHTCMYPPPPPYIHYIELYRGLSNQKGGKPQTNLEM